MVTTAAQGAADPADAIQDVLNLLRSVVRRSWRYWYLIPVTAVLAAVAFVLGPFVRPPVYRSEVVLAFNKGLDSETYLATESGSENTRTRNARLQALVFSRPLLRALVEREHISPTIVATAGMARAIEEVGKNVSFSAGEGNTFVIQFTSEDRGLAQRGARGVGQLLVDRVSRDQAGEAAATRKFLEDEEAKLAESLRAIEGEYATFVAQHPEFALDRTQSQTPGVAVRAAASASATAAGSTDANAALRRQADRIRTRLSQTSNPQPAALAGVASTAELQMTPESRDAIAAAQGEVRRAQEELAAKQAKYTPLHPDVVAAQARLSAAEKRLNSVRVAAQRTAVPAQAKGMPVRPVEPETEQALQKELRNVEAQIYAGRKGGREDAGAGTSGSAQQIVGLETTWAALMRGMDGARERYESVRRRLNNAILVSNAQSTGGGTQIVVVEDAYYPKQVFQRAPLMTSLFAGGTALAFGLSVMLCLGFFDPRIVSQWDLERAGLAPIALYIPRLPKPRGRRG